MAKKQEQRPHGRLAQSAAVVNLESIDDPVKCELGDAKSEVHRATAVVPTVPIQLKHEM